MIIIYYILRILERREIFGDIGDKETFRSHCAAGRLNESDEKLLESSWTRFATSGGSQMPF